MEQQNHMQQHQHMKAQHQNQQKSTPPQPQQQQPNVPQQNHLQHQQQHPQQLSHSRDQTHNQQLQNHLQKLQHQSIHQMQQQHPHLHQHQTMNHMQQQSHNQHQQQNTNQLQQQSVNQLQQQNHSQQHMHQSQSQQLLHQTHQQLQLQQSHHQQHMIQNHQQQQTSQQLQNHLLHHQVIRQQQQHNQKQKSLLQQQQQALLQQQQALQQQLLQNHQHQQQQQQQNHHQQQSNHAQQQSHLQQLQNQQQHQVNTHHQHVQQSQEKKQEHVGQQLQAYLSSASNRGRSNSISLAINTPTGQSSSNHRSILSGIVKKESPLDLSVKTVRQSADSTAKDESEQLFNSYRFHNNEFLRNKTPPTALGRSSTMGYETNRSVTIPKVDFLPNFERQTGLSHQNFQPETKKQSKPESQGVPSQYYPNLPSVGTFSKSGYSIGAYYPPASSPHQRLPSPYQQAAPQRDKRFHESPSPAQGTSIPPEATASLGKRPPSGPGQAPAPKLPRIESWRQSIDQQIEKKFNTYLSSKDMVNGETDQQSLLMPAYSRQNRVSPMMPYDYQPTRFKPPSSTITSQQAQMYERAKSRDFPQVPPKVPIIPNNRTADKRVLSILRNNLEAKNIQAQQQKNLQPLPSNPADLLKTYQPIEPKLDPTRNVFMHNNFLAQSGRHNLPPFGVIAADRNSTSPFPGHKLHLPKAVDSVIPKDAMLPPAIIPPANIPLASMHPASMHPASMHPASMPPASLPPASIPPASIPPASIPPASIPQRVQEVVDITDDDEEVKTIKAEMVPNGVHSNGELDGLAAFLAARIRTKAELKQVDPTAVSDCTAEQADIFPKPIEMTPTDSIKSGQEVQNSTSGSKASTCSPPKLTKEPNGTTTVVLPRRRLFSRSDEDVSSEVGEPVVPRRDVTGLRSSSETSVFDFRDSGSEGEMPVLERQTLHEMRKDRRPTPSKGREKIEDPSWNETCEQLMMQLQTGSPRKRRGRRKKNPELMGPEVDKLDCNSTHLKEELDCDIKQEIDSTENTKDDIVDGEEKLFVEEDPSLIEKKEIKPEIESEEGSSGEESETSSSEEESVRYVARKLRQRKPTTRSRMKLRDREPSATPRKRRIIKKKRKTKQNFNEGSFFDPGWEEELYKYKRSLRMPTRLITISRPPGWPRGTLSLPDLEQYPDSPFTADSSMDCTPRKGDNSDMEQTGGNEKKTEDKVSKAKKSLGEEKSFLDRLMQKYCARKKKTKKSSLDSKLEIKPKIVPISSSGPELLPTPTLDAQAKVKNMKELCSMSKLSRGKKPADASGCDIKDSVYLGYFRKQTVNDFREAFVKHNGGFSGENDVAPLVLQSRTRTETKVMKERATIREVFGAERPASAPPAGYREAGRGKQSAGVIRSKKALRQSKQQLLQGEKRRKRNRDLLQAYKLRNTEEVDTNAIPSLRANKRLKLRTIRRKLKSSGFDYIRKKKKQQQKREGCEQPKEKRRGNHKTKLMTEQEIQAEIKGWVINKGLGETLLHRASRLGYTDIAAYCLEKLHHNPSPRDNAGYTPLHEACSRGHIKIAKLLLNYGANVSDSALGGVRPLHEAAENGFSEIIQLLLEHGADPQLATYSGHSPLSLATDDQIKKLMEFHIDKNKTIKSVETPTTSEANTSAAADDMDKIDGFEIEESEVPLPNLYRLSGEPRTDSWVLFHELAPLVHVKTREALLKQLGQEARHVLRDMKLSEFYAKAHCRTIRADPKVNPKVIKVTLVKYTDAIKFLLGVETTVIPR